MAHLRHDQRLLTEPLLCAGILGTQWRTQQLDGREAAEVDVLREVDSPHATGSETTQHPVPPGEQLADAVSRRAPFRFEDEVAHRGFKVQAHCPLLSRPTQVLPAPCSGRSTRPWHRT